ncbi:MAG: chorismate synthase [Candidatus Bathyarchaeia archaeon]
MPGNSIGKSFIVTSFGESHGRCIGVVIDGCPPGIPISEQDIQVELDRRRPTGGVLSTPRVEEDKVEFLSGVFRGFTTGAPLCLIIWNKDVQSEAYEEFRRKPRPGHADYPAFIRYKGFEDYRGGGRFSARNTAGMVMAGAIAKKILELIDMEVLAHVVEIGGVPLTRQPRIEEIREMRYSNEVRCVEKEAAAAMVKAILAAKSEGDSVGGIVECIVTNPPPGVGDPIFDSLDSNLAQILLTVPAVKGVEFGSGFRAARVRGSENNDQYTVRDGKIVTLTNNSGGILGGLTSGMPIVTRVALKPVSSIPTAQQTVDLETMTDTSLEAKGRYDPCVVPRAVPVVEAVVAIVMTDHLLRLGLVGP